MPPLLLWYGGAAIVTGVGGYIVAEKVAKIAAPVLLVTSFYFIYKELKG